MDKQNLENNKPIKQICRICGKRPASSREHLPQKAVSNRGKVEINFIDGAIPSGEMQVRIIYSRDGFWAPSSCDSCNNKLGSRYGGAYKDFVLQISNASGIEDTANRVFTHLKGIYPLRILKQMFYMFLAALPYEPTFIWKDIQDFVCKRDNTLPKVAPSVYLYKNTSKMGRIVPCCGIAELATHKNIVVAEISWPPVGIVFSFQQDDRFAMMEDITHWGHYKFKDKEDLIIRLPKLRVSSHYPLSFGSPEQLEQEQSSRLPVCLFHVPDNAQSLTDIGVLWKRRK